MEGDDDIDTSEELIGGDAFDKIEARVLARASNDDEIEDELEEDADADAEPDDESDEESEGGDEADSEEEPEGDAAPQAGRSADDGLLTLKGPWGEETVDPRTPEGRARAVELAQKGRNYDHLVSEDDARVRRRAEEIARAQTQRDTFDLYRRFGLVTVNARGESEWTEKGLRYARAVQEGKETPLEDRPAAAKPNSEQAPDDELDRLADIVLKAPDDAQAKQALVRALQRIQSNAEERATRAASEEVDGRLTRLTEAQRAQAAQSQAQAHAQNLRTEFQSRLSAEVEKSSVLAGDAAALEMARREVFARVTQFAEAEKAGRAVPPDFLDVALREGVAATQRYYDGVMQRGVKRFQTEAQKRRSTPPATGGGSSAPVARRKAPESGRTRLFDDSFQEEMEDKALRG